MVLFSLRPAVIDLGVAAAGRNVSIKGIYHSDHHGALLASLRIGCNAYASAAEAAQGANVVLLGVDSPDLDLSSAAVLRLCLEAEGPAQRPAFRCSPEQREWAEELLAFLGRARTDLA